MTSATEGKMCLYLSSWGLWQQSENLAYVTLAWYSKRELRMGSCNLVRLTELWNAWCPEQSRACRLISIFFLQTNGWTSHITKSHFRNVERFWTNLHNAENLGSYHGLCGHHSQGFFPMQSNWLVFFSNQSLCIRKEALGTRLSK